MWTSVICSSFAWHLPAPRHHTTPLEKGIHPISSYCAVVSTSGNVAGVN